MRAKQRIPGHVHLVGIGGMHMSAIARILMAWGHQVSGSDQRRSPLTDAVAAEGARVFIGHDAANVGDAGLVVTTSAAPGSNPELAEAAGRGIPVIKRAEMVARLMEGRTGVCIAGSHGKSTTSGLVAYLLRECGGDPTFLIGAEIAALGTNAAAGSGPHVVVEADEYDRAFLSYHPDVALVLNVEPDHLDYYGTEAAMREAFQGFVSNVVAGGTAILCADSPGAMALRPRVPRGVNVETFGLGHDLRIRASPKAGWVARLAREDRRARRRSRGPRPHPNPLSEGEGTGAVTAGANEYQRFQVIRYGQEFGEFTIALAGVHNVSNALGAIAVAATLGLTAAEMRPALARYTGVRRRFEVVGEVDGITVMDDYAHHPTEVEAIAAAARVRFPGRRIVVLFQPHTYARTRYLLEGWRRCFRGFDRLFLLETYAAREAMADGMTAEQLVQEVESPKPAYCPDFDSAAAAVAADLRPGDVFFTMGAGDVDAVGPMVLKELNARRAASSPSSPGGKGGRGARASSS